MNGSNNEEYNSAKIFDSATIINVPNSSNSFSTHNVKSQLNAQPKPTCTLALNLRGASIIGRGASNTGLTNRPTKKSKHPQQLSGTHGTMSNGSQTPLRRVYSAKTKHITEQGRIQRQKVTSNMPQKPTWFQSNPTSTLALKLRGPIIGRGAWSIEHANMTRKQEKSSLCQRQHS